MCNQEQEERRKKKRYKSVYKKNRSWSKLDRSKIRDKSASADLTDKK